MNTTEQNNSLKVFSEGHAILFYGENDHGPMACLAALASPKNKGAVDTLLHIGSQLSLYADKQWMKNLADNNPMHGDTTFVSCQLLSHKLIERIDHLQETLFLQSIGDDSLALKKFKEERNIKRMQCEDWLYEWMGHLEDHGSLLWLSPLRNNKGEVPNLKECEAIAQQNSLTIVHQEEIVRSRVYNPRLIERTGIMDTKLLSGSFQLHSFYSSLDSCYHWAFVYGKPEDNEQIPLIRIESECLTGHVFGSLLCDCGNQLEQGLEKISQHGCGVLIYLRQEGRGIGLVSKIKAYKLQQDASLDTVDANLALGMPEDARDYIIGAQILHILNIQKLKLMTNNPSKVEGLERYGFNVCERVSHIIPPSKHNKRYLATKKDRMGHLI